MPPAAHRKSRPATEEEVRVLASAFRLRILRLCLDRPLTNKEIAARLGVHPATTLHHVRRLVATGFLAAQQERRGARGAREVPYLATGKSWTLDVEESHAGDQARATIDAFVDEVRLSNPDQVHTWRLGLRLDEKQLAELRDRLGELLDEFAARQMDPSGRAYSLFVAVHPDALRD
ncbi:MAG TPA: winged helix-turn-helix domain-containing protein [Micromonosporaceae bacterium]